MAAKAARYSQGTRVLPFTILLLQILLKKDVNTKNCCPIKISSYIFKCTLSSNKTAVFLFALFNCYFPFQLWFDTPYFSL